MTTTKSRHSIVDLASKPSPSKHWKAESGHGRVHTSTAPRVRRTQSQSESVEEHVEVVVVRI